MGVAVPKDRSMYGYISEHHTSGPSADAVAEYAEDLAAQMLATALGAPFDPEVESRSYAMAAEVPDQGTWATVVAAAVVCG